MNAPNLVAVSGPTDGKAGHIVYWRLSGGLDLDSLTAAWQKANLPVNLLPTEPTPRVALTRAISEMKSSRCIPVTLSNGGYTVTHIHEDTKNQDLSFKTSVSVSLNKVGQLVAKATTPQEVEEARKIQERFKYHLTHISQQDVSPWLCKMAVWAEAISLRDTGGFYFVPAYVLDRWNKVVDCVRSTSNHSISQISAYASDGEAIDAIMEAIVLEAEGHVADMQKQMADTEMGSRALKGRVASTEAVERKLSRYEALLGEKLDGTRTQLEAVRAQLCVAMVQAETAEAQEAANAKRA